MFLQDRDENNDDEDNEDNDDEDEDDEDEDEEDENDMIILSQLTEGQTNKITRDLNQFNLDTMQLRL